MCVCVYVCIPYVFECPVTGHSGLTDPLSSPWPSQSQIQSSLPLCPLRVMTRLGPVCEVFDKNATLDRLQVSEVKSQIHNKKGRFSKKGPKGQKRYQKRFQRNSHV